ncbi:MAG: methyltransferase [Candidatus Aenigmatarchaeota archaeon]
MEFLKSKIFYNFDINILEFLIDENVYCPEEDSLFFADFVIEYLSNYFKLEKKYFKQRKNSRTIENILEVGCGCGFLSIIIYKFFEKNLGKDVDRMKFVAVDINRKSIENTKINAKRHEAKILVKYSNLFENIDEKFDLIIFNAPYLPVEEDYSYSIFQKGENIVNKFLIDAKEFMNDNAIILLLVSSITPIRIPDSYTARIIKRKKIDWEELRIYEIKLKL